MIPLFDPFCGVYMISLVPICGLAMFSYQTGCVCWYSLFNHLIDCVCLFVQGETSLIHKIGATDGIFLIRKSSKGDTYALTLCHEQQIFHYEIKVLVSAKYMECISYLFHCFVLLRTNSWLMLTAARAPGHWMLPYVCSSFTVFFFCKQSAISFTSCQWSAPFCEIVYTL